MSSFGWNPTSKQDELFHRLSRFILIYAADDLVAFTMFRFEYEDKEELLYCYELQIRESHWRKGLGKLLIQILERIGVEWGMEKVMLTVFKVNEDAIKFYHALGFTMDESSPGYLEEDDDMDTVEGVDYEILSMRLPRKIASQQT
ncbi:hypothetical protein H0H87_003839 [Tephrocybe sp. NHM501043]|nr:hypothetical protein H0H87_003839 [Tephrocybe sp. NHM501043]